MWPAASVGSSLYTVGNGMILSSITVSGPSRYTCTVMPSARRASRAGSTWSSGPSTTLRAASSSATVSAVSCVQRGVRVVDRERDVVRRAQHQRLTARDAAVTADAYEPRRGR